MADLKINEKEYLGVKEVQIPFVDGNGNAVFKLDEIMEYSLLGTTEREMTISEIFTQYPITRKHKDSVIFVRFYGDTAPTQGSDSCNWMILFVNDDDITENYVGSGNIFAVLNFQNGLIAPNKMGCITSPSGKPTTNIKFNEQGAVTCVQSTTYVPVGTEIRVLEFPFSFTDMVSNPLS